MGLVTTMQQLETSGAEELQKYNPNRPIMVDGSLSEMVTQALNIAFSKKNFTTGEPNFGHQNANGNPPPGAGSIANILDPASPGVVHPTMEGMQQMQSAQNTELALALADAIDASHHEDDVIVEKPIMIYAIPQDKKISESMNDDLDAYKSIGAIGKDLSDFVFVYTDENSSMQQGVQVVDSQDILKEYQERGARVFADVESFLVALPDIRRRK